MDNGSDDAYNKAAFQALLDFGAFQLSRGTGSPSIEVEEASGSRFTTDGQRGDSPDSPRPLSPPPQVEKTTESHSTAGGHGKVNEPETTGPLPPSNVILGFWHASNANKWLYAWAVSLMVLGLVFLYLLVPHVLGWRKTVDCSVMSGRTYAESPDLTNIVPLPHDITERAHAIILTELHDLEKLPSFINTRSDVYLSTMATNQELTKLLACALKRSGKKATLAVLHQLNLVQEQVKYTMANATCLYNLYASIRPVYNEFNLTAAKALEVTQLNDRKSFMVSSQPLFNKLLGFDYKKMYWDPWEEKKQKFEDIQPGIVALEKESERLAKIDQVVQEIDRNLERLLNTWMERRLGQQLEGGGSWKKELKDWYWQHVARYILQDEEALTYSQFDTWWTSLDCWCHL